MDDAKQDKEEKECSSGSKRFIEDIAAAVEAAEAAAAAAASTSFQPRTIRQGSINSERRVAILPAYPISRSENQRRVLLLLSNVPNIDREQCEQVSFCGGAGGNDACPFNFQRVPNLDPIDSFMIDFYRDLFIKPSRLWKIHYSLIDFNLSRLRECMELYTKQTTDPAIASLNELTLALEFFLQIDVDTFFMKTCNFRGAHPRLLHHSSENAAEEMVVEQQEGILCEAEPQARYGMIPCRQQNCFLCERELLRQVVQAGGKRRRIAIENSSSSSSIDQILKPGVHFSPNQIHHFVNKYEAILNCPAKCTTSNIIYALTCLCDKFDFIGSTVMTFHDRMLKHRAENNRIIREFLIGINNINHILRESTRSAETLENNNMLLYQHSPRCSLVLQWFLDHNPEYWCFVPMLYDEARVDNRAYASTCSSTSRANIKRITDVPIYPPESPTFIKKPQFFESVLTNTTRSDEECIWIAKGVPKPPLGFTFSHRQIDEQINFFKFKKESNIMCMHLVDCYKYTIIAVLPDDCSHELRRFIEALFITHAETKFNTLGRLTHKITLASSLAVTNSFEHSNRGAWCKELVRNSSSSSRTNKH